MRVLPDTVASQVAAGEVVERPASVAKELVENSLDAGASEVFVEIQRGGVALIRVSDNGAGMRREDALVSLERHATSKLRDAAGLQRITTLGFRGEALPSIASVSRFRMQTRPASEVAGTEIEVEGGRVTAVKDAGCAVGTVIEVRDLFFNVPARRKFLKAETTEAAHIEHQLRLHALAAPGVRFRFHRDRREIFDLARGMSRLERLRALLGIEAARELLEMPETRGRGSIVSGYVLPAGHARRGRRHQCVFLNGRPVEDPVISRGLQEGFGGGLGEGLHPAAWLWIDLDPALVDVNAHPAKREIRLHRPHELRQAIAAAVEGATSRERAAQRGRSATAEFFPVRVDVPGRAAGPAGPENLDLGAPARAWRPVEREQELAGEVAGATLRPACPQFRWIGTLLERFALFESEDGLVVMDPRAARERILYEQWLALGGGQVQALLIPLVLELEPREAELLLRNREVFLAAGFELGEFGGKSLRVSTTPDFVADSEVERLLLEVADELAGGGSPTTRFALDKLAKTLARRAAQLEPVRAEEAAALLAVLFECDLPYCAADGRPTLTEFSRAEMERRFGLSRGKA